MKRTAYLMAGRHGLATPRYREILVEYGSGVGVPSFPRLGPLGAPDDAERYQRIGEIAAGTYDLMFPTEELRDEIDRFGADLIDALLPNLGKMPEIELDGILQDVASSASGIERLDPQAMARLAGVEQDIPAGAVETVLAPALVPIFPLAGTIASDGDLRTIARTARALATALGDVLGGESSARQREDREIACAKLAPIFLAFIGSNPMRAALMTLVTPQLAAPSPGVEEP